MLPVFARDVLHAGPEGLGHLRAAPALLGAMPGGADVGDLIHRVLEATDFASADLDAELAAHLVEERRLERGAAARETLAEPRGREERVERLVSHPRGQIRLCLPGLEQKPGAEAPHVAVRDIRSVV